MVIFLQATALRYDADLDFECECNDLSSFGRLCKYVLIFLVLITTSMYWSMIEVGSGFIAANLIIIYGLLTGHALQNLLQSVRSVVSSIGLSKSSRTSRSSRNRQESLHSEEGKMWTGPNGDISSSAEYAGREPTLKEEEMDGKRIHMTQMVKTTEERVRRVSFKVCVHCSRLQSVLYPQVIEAARNLKSLRFFHWCEIMYHCQVDGPSGPYQKP